MPSDHEATHPEVETEAAPAPAEPLPPDRVESVDVLRGLTILLMVFVNDLGAAAPSWLHHIAPPKADGMTVADVVFPWFLFIVGVSIPLAMERAFARGATLGGEVGHILARTAGLLLLGVISNNAGADQTLGGHWGTVSYIAVLLAWAAVPSKPGPRRNTFLALKGLGIVALIALLIVYRRKPVDTELMFYGPVEGWRWLRTGWWGILGLIGWAYLTVALLTLWLGRRREWLTGLIGVLILFHLAMRHGGLFERVDDKAWLAPLRPALALLARGVDAIGEYVNLGDATGSLAAVVAAGCVLGSILKRGSDVATPGERTSWALTFALGLFLAGAVADTFEGINKIAATPTWCLGSAGLAVVAWVGLYRLIDVAGWRGWTILVRPAGANPLIAFFLHPLLLKLVSAAGLWGTLLGYKDSSAPGIVVGGSFVMAMTVCGLTGLLARLGLRVKL